MNRKRHKNKMVLNKQSIAVLESSRIDMLKGWAGLDSGAPTIAGDKFAPCQTEHPPRICDQMASVRNCNVF